MDIVDYGKLFSARGRIGRLNYLTLCAGTVVLGTIVTIISTAFDGTWGPIVGIGLYVIWLPAGIMTTIKPFHDFEWSGWRVLLGLIPFVGLVLLLGISCLRAGDEDVNAFGLPNSGSPFPTFHGVPVSAVSRVAVTEREGAMKPVIVEGDRPSG